MFSCYFSPDTSSGVPTLVTLRLEFASLLSVIIFQIINYVMLYHLPFQTVGEKTVFEYFTGA